MRSALAVTLVFFSVLPAFADPTTQPLQLQFRRRVETAPSSGQWKAVTEPAQWEPRKTAVVICDMWDDHWCKSAARRVAEMAPRMNDLISALRDRGVLIIHCPSDTMKYYEGTPGRKLAQSAPKVETAVPIQRWCKLDPAKEAPLPVDDSDNGCPDGPPPKNVVVWSHQIDTLQIKDGDAITDSAEAFYLMKQRGITNVMVMGVHANMCVLGRSFSIRQMVTQGQHVVLVRDLTDSMYNPAMPPKVDHFTGTDLIVEHVEKYWCPTMTSDQVLGGKPFKFKEDTRPYGNVERKTHLP
jgi:nicotinamidase-related amidase